MTASPAKRSNQEPADAAPLSAEELSLAWRCVIEGSGDRSRTPLNTARLLATIAARDERIAELEGIERRAKKCLDALDPNSEERLWKLNRGPAFFYILTGESSE